MGGFTSCFTKVFWSTFRSRFDLSSLLFDCSPIPRFSHSDFSLLNDAAEIFSAFFINEWLFGNLSNIVFNSIKCSYVNHVLFRRFFNFSDSMDLNIACSKLLGSTFCRSSIMSASMFNLFNIFVIKFSCPIISIVELNSLFSSCFMSACFIPFTSHLIIWWNWSFSSSKTNLMIHLIDLHKFLKNRMILETLHIDRRWWIIKWLDNQQIDPDRQYLIWSPLVSFALSFDSFHAKVNLSPLQIRCLCLLKCPYLLNRIVEIDYRFSISLVC